MQRGRLGVSLDSLLKQNDGSSHIEPGDEFMLK